MIGFLLALTTLSATPQLPPRATVLLIPLTANTSDRNQDFAATVPLTTAAEGVRFDLDADGVAELTPWSKAGAEIAFLAYDRNGNGIIENGTELIGDRSHHGSPNGFHALRRMMPINGPTGWLDADDPLFPLLLLWTDKNHNGVSEPTELRPASELLARIGLGYIHHNRRDGHGNEFRFRGFATIRTAPGIDEPRDGKDSKEREIKIYDVFLVKQ